MFGWHHRLNRYESEKALGDGEGLENLACCRGYKKSDATDNWITSEAKQEKNERIPKLLILEIKKIIITEHKDIIKIIKEEYLTIFNNR